MEARFLERFDSAMRLVPRDWEIGSVASSVLKFLFSGAEDSDKPTSGRALVEKNGGRMASIAPVRSALFSVRFGRVRMGGVDGTDGV